MSSISEKLLEDEITAHLVTDGWLSGLQDRDRSRVAEDFDAHARSRHAGAVRLHRSRPRAASGRSSSRLTAAKMRTRGSGSSQRLAQQIDERGTVDVLRHGVRDQNVEIRLSYRKPAFGVAPELVAALRRQPADGHAPASVRPRLEQDARPVPVPQRHPGRDGGAEEPPHRPEHRARDRAVPQQTAIRRTSRSDDGRSSISLSTPTRSR